MRLPKYDGRCWRQLMLPCALSLISLAWVGAHMAAGSHLNLTARLASLLVIPCQWSMMFYVGANYAMDDILRILREKDRRRAVSEVMADLGIKDQKHP